MVAEGAADDAEGLGESVSLEAGDLPRKGMLLPSLFHPAFSCVAAAEICSPGTKRSRTIDAYMYILHKKRDKPIHINSMQQNKRKSLTQSNCRQGPLAYMPPRLARVPTDIGNGKGRACRALPSDSA